MLGSYFDKWVIIKCSQQVARLWNATPAISELQAATLSRINLHYIKSALSVYYILSLHLGKSEGSKVI